VQTILITGGAGFIASSVIDLLLSQGDKVIVFDNNFKSSADTLIPFITDENFTYVMGDVTDYDSVLNAFKTYKPDIILHAAALVGAPICTKYKYLASLVNIRGTENVSKAAHYFNIRLLFFSTGSVYEPGQGNCDENSSVKPPSHYGYTKIVGENIVLEYDNNIVYRYGTAMGVSKNNIRVNLLVNDLTYQSFLNKTITLFEHTFLRSFIHVRDIASAVVYAVNNWERVRQTGCLFNVSNNDLNMTKGAVAEMIAAKLGTNVCYAEVGKDADQRNYLMNNDLIYSTGWTSMVGMDETLDELIKVAPLLSQYEKYK